ncbi:MAG: hypothetical protein V3U88_07220 [Methylococcales bacterium]
MADYTVVEKQLEQEVSDAKSFLDEHYQDILENFDFKVVKLRKKSKVIMSVGILDDFEKLSQYADIIKSSLLSCLMIHEVRYFVVVPSEKYVRSILSQRT